MLLEVKILRTHLRAEDPRTIRSFAKDQIVSVKEKFANEIIKDGDGILTSEEKSISKASENKAIESSDMENKSITFKTTKKGIK